MRSLRIRALLIGTALLATTAGGFAAGAATSPPPLPGDQSGTVGQLTVHEIGRIGLPFFPPPVTFPPVTWDDSQGHLLPGSVVTLTVPKNQLLFFTIGTELVQSFSVLGSGGIFCKGFSGTIIPPPNTAVASAVLQSAYGTVIPLNGSNGFQTLVTPILGPGTYTFGYSATCPAGATNDPNASYYLQQNQFVITTVRT